MASFSFLNQSDLNILTDKATELGCKVSYLEKDYYLIQLIKCLQKFSVKDGSFIFTGGTALVKGYKLIDRFSEDCDFIFLKNRCNRRERSIVKEKLLDHFKQNGFLVSNCTSKNESKHWLFQIEYKQLSQEEHNLRPNLKLEIVHKECIKIGNLPEESIQSFLAEAKNNIPEVANITCLYC